MLYRLTPPARVEWTDFHAGTEALETAVEHGASGLDRLEWRRAEQRAFSSDLLRMALRHGVASSDGIVLSAMHTGDLGRADELRLSQRQVDESQAKLREHSGALMESLIPGWAASGKELDDRVRRSSERVAQEAEADLARALAAPIKPALAEHWVRLGGQLPD